MYSEDYLLDRLYSVIGENGIRGKINMPKPNTKLMNKKTFLNNYTEIVSKLQRDHVISFAEFIQNELTTDTSVNAENQLVITGIFRNPSLEKAIKSYCIKFVQCKSCKGGDTSVIKEGKILFIDCKKCKSKLAIE